MRTVCSFYGLPAALILRLICLKNKQKVWTWKSVFFFHCKDFIFFIFRTLTRKRKRVRFAWCLSDVRLDEQGGRKEQHHEVNYLQINLLILSQSVMYNILNNYIW
jgi:hypothetical protein